MVGPSSSHTAGVVSIGKFVYELLGSAPKRASIVFYDSFSETYKGHGTDKAVVGGLIGLDTDDLRIRQAMELAVARGVDIAFSFAELCPFYDHPNTVLIEAESEADVIQAGGVSLGGGISKIVWLNGERVDIALNQPYDPGRIRREQTAICERAWIRSEKSWISVR
jgi:L-serine dehydratase